MSVPDTDGRYYLLPMLDMWTDVFASPGWRTTGTQGRQLSGHAAGLAAGLRDRFIENSNCRRMTQRIEAPTPIVWIIGRTKTDGPADYDAVHKIQAGLQGHHAVRMGQGAASRSRSRSIPSVDMKTPPKVQVDTMPAAKYFAYAAELLKLHPPHHHRRADPRADEADRHRAWQELRLRQAATGDTQAARRGSPEAAQKLMEWKVATLARVVEPLVAEHRHDGRLRQLLPQARHRLPAWSRREPAGGCDLSAQSWRRGRPAARRRAQVRDALRQGGRAARRMPSGRSRSTIRRASRSPTASTASRSAVGCRSSTMPDGSLDALFPE